MRTRWTVSVRSRSRARALLRMSDARIPKPGSTGVENGSRLNWKNLSEQEREPTTNSTHIWCRCQDSNPGHIGRRRVLSHHSTIPGSTTISSLAILDFRAVLYCAWAKDEKSSQSRGSDDRNSVSMARARERNIPTPTAQQATIDLLKQPLLEINYFIEVMVIQ